MKQYYLHNGTEQLGPFTIDELKTKSITKETSIWYEGIAEWTTAGNVDELKELFKIPTPPPFVVKDSIPIPPPMPRINRDSKNTPIIQQHSTKKKSYTSIKIASLFIIGLILFLIYEASNRSGSGTHVESYEEKVLTVEDMERSQPANFLNVSANYDKNFWGTKINLHGEIVSKATVASYKDAVIKVVYYSKTKTELLSKEYTIYDNFPPHSVTPFELEIKNYSDVNSIGIDFVNATAK